jgi:hypothetical protein
MSDLDLFGWAARQPTVPAPSLAPPIRQKPATAKLICFPLHRRADLIRKTAVKMLDMDFRHRQYRLDWLGQKLSKSLRGRGFDEWTVERQVRSLTQAIIDAANRLERGEDEAAG